HGARLLAVRRRAGLRALHAAGRARSAQLLRALPAGERISADPALVAIFRLGALVAERQRAAGCGGRRGVVRPVAAPGVPLGGGAGGHARAPGAGGVLRRARAAVARDRSTTLLGRGE